MHFFLLQRKTKVEGVKKAVPIKDQLEGMAMTSTAADALLQGPPTPRGTAFWVVWSWFLELNDERQSSGFGISRLSSAQIMAWSRLEGLRIPTWARRCLRRIDRAYVQANSLDDEDILGELKKLQGE
jgi:hypothetical protein